MAADPHSAEYHAQVLSNKPPGVLGGLPATADEQKAALAGNPALLKALVDGLTADERSVQFSLAVLYDLLRSDGSCFSLFEKNLAQLNFYRQAMTAVRANSVFVADKAAWLLSGVIGNVPMGFSASDVQAFLDVLSGSGFSGSEQGKLDAVVNVLKASSFKGLVLKTPSFMDMGFNAQTAAPGIIYKKLFALWLVSFDGAALPFKAEVIAQKMKEVLTYQRVEKVVRLALTCLQGLISYPDVADECVEQGLLEVVQSLEYEKWRDAELYDDIRNMSAALGSRVQEMSNFARYERELATGKLKWGFIHSPKFWSENVLKFEQNDWKALRSLSACLDLNDATTVAVACHDMGEFVTAHPLGKKQVTALGVKNKVMKLMSAVTDKDIKREALLCCQKIMLNKWQDVDTTGAKGEK